MWLYSYSISSFVSKNVSYVKIKQILFKLLHFKNNNLCVNEVNFAFLKANYYFFKLHNVKSICLMLTYRTFFERQKLI